MLVTAIVSTPVFAQASPFVTGATALQAIILAWLTPIAIILVMVPGAMPLANRIAFASASSSSDPVGGAAGR